MRSTIWDKQAHQHARQNLKLDSRLKQSTPTREAKRETRLPLETKHTNTRGKT